MSISNRKLQPVIGLAAVALISLGFVSLTSKAAVPTAAPKDTYQWSATLVSFDMDSKTAVMQALVDSWTKIPGLDDFKEGQKLTLVWTGREWAAGVRDLAENPKLMPGALTLPVEFVSSERDGEFVNFRIHVPADSAHMLSMIKPGERVTGVSPKTAKDAMSAIISMHAYNDVG